MTHYKKIKFILSVCFGLCSFFAVSQNSDNKLTEYVDFLQTQNTSAKDYVLGLFDKYNIVVLCERHHAEMTQYDLIFDIVSDSRFTSQGGQIMMEVGVSNLEERLNAFLQNDTLSDEKVEYNILNIIRYNDYYPLWEMTNYPVFIKKLHNLNKTLPQKEKITIHPVDLPFSWTDITSKKQYKIIMVSTDLTRDDIMGEQMQKIIEENPDKKFLIIMNAYHSWFVPEKYGASWWVKNAAGEKAVNVLLSNTWVGTLTDEGKWDAAFKMANKENLGFDLENTPFGQTDFLKYFFKGGFVFKIDTLLKNHNKMQDFYHGYVFYKPIEQHILSFGYPNYISGNFKKEMNRRVKIAWGNFDAILGKYKIRNFYNKVRAKQYHDIDKLIKQRDKWIKNK